jgi:hypothetical protein
MPRRDTFNTEVYVSGTMYTVPAPVEVEIARLRDVEIAARALWDAHCKSHEAHKSPDRGFNHLRYAMNYGELVDLAKSLGITPRETVHSD